MLGSYIDYANKTAKTINSVFKEQLTDQIICKSFLCYF